jgi:uncharacterized YigZ family protein
MAETDTYLTIDGPAEGIYREKGSRFMAFAAPVRNQAEINQLLDRLKKDYFDARHHCYAWVLGPDGKQSRTNDGGEPSHSAGDPILGQIRSRGLTDVLVAVVRYFGGTKLGMGGLIAAYRMAAAEALQAAAIVEKRVQVLLSLRFAWPATGFVMKIIREDGLEIVRKESDNECRKEVLVRLCLAGDVADRLAHNEVLEEIH